VEDNYMVIRLNMVSVLINIFCVSVLDPRRRLWSLLLFLLYSV